MKIEEAVECMSKINLHRILDFLPAKGGAPRLVAAKRDLVFPDPPASTR